MSLTRNRRRSSAASFSEAAPVFVPSAEPAARPAVRAPRAALLQPPTVTVVSSRIGTRRVREENPGNTVVVVSKKPASGRNLPHWKQSERWFWLTHPETLAKELVKPSGTTHVQGPFEMVQYTTQGGSLKACTVSFFEANSEPWNPASGMR